MKEKYNSKFFNKVEIPTFTGYLSCNCVCFQNEAFFPPKKTSKKLADYVKQEKRKCLAMDDEIQKHQFFDVQNVNTCYGVTLTTALILRSSYLRHQESLKKLKLATKKSSNIYVQFDEMDNGKVVSVDVYIQTLKQLLDARITTLENFANASTFVCVLKLKQSEKNHFQTIKVLENVIQDADQGFNKLEIPIESPE